MHEGPGRLVDVKALGIRHCRTSLTVSVEFYVTFLPILIWVRFCGAIIVPAKRPYSSHAELLCEHVTPWNVSKGMAGASFSYC